MGLGQFLPQILSLQEQAYRARACESNGVAQQSGQRGTGPAGDDVKRLGRGVFHAGVQHPDVIQLHARCRSREECALLGGGFEQGHLQPVPEHRRQDQAGEPGARPKVGQRSGGFGNKGGQLGAVQEVTAP